LKLKELLLLVIASSTQAAPGQGWLPLYKDDTKEAFLESIYKKPDEHSMSVRVLINHLKPDMVTKEVKSAITERIYDCKNFRWAIAKIEFYSAPNGKGKLLGDNKPESLKWYKFSEESTANFVHNKVCKSLL